MTKADLMNALIEKKGLLHKECAQIVEAVFELMRVSPETGEQVKIAGLGDQKAPSKDGKYDLSFLQ